MTGAPAGQRLFLAVFPPPEVGAAVMRVVDALRTGGDRVAWVKRENLHYTLRFLGAVDEEQEAAAAEAASEAAGAHAAFAASLAAPGAFPDASRARVLWFGIGEGGQALRALANSLELALLARGFPRAEQPFAPHLTIGRLRVSADCAARLAGAPVAEGRFRVDRIALVRSTLSPGGSRYERLSEALLRS